MQIRFPFNFYFAAPSCVPVTPFETSGAVLDTDDIEYLLKKDEIVSLGEMMNYPGVINGDEEVLKKLRLAKKNMENRLTVMHHWLPVKIWINTFPTV